jgi:uncharacterized membrane protein (DUF485 family)
MTDAHAPDGGSGEAGTSDAIDYRRIESSDEFRELVSRRKRFLTIASVIVFGEFGLYLLLAAFATDFMGTQILGGLPIAWLAAMAQVILTWAVTWAYLNKAENEFEPMERRAAARAEARFTRDDGDEAQAEPASETATAERSAR